jgi:Sporulation and spore germination
MTGVLRRAGAVVLLLAGVGLLTACGIPNMSEPAAVSTLATPTRPASAASSYPTTTGRGPEVYLVGSDARLVPVRHVPASGDVAAMATQALSQLTAGPDPDEQARGLSSAIPPGLSVMLVRLKGPLAIVDVKGTDPGPATEEAKLATAQVVLTLTSIPGVDSVLLTRNGVPQAVLPDGELTQLPISREDVAGLLKQ